MQSSRDIDYKLWDSLNTVEQHIWRSVEWHIFDHIKLTELDNGNNPLTTMFWWCDSIHMLLHNTMAKKTAQAQYDYS